MKSCKTCVDNAERLLPSLDDKMRWSLLMGETAFPMGTCSYNLRQLRKVRRRLRRGGWLKAGRISARQGAAN